MVKKTKKGDRIPMMRDQDVSENNPKRRQGKKTAKSKPSEALQTFETDNGTETKETSQALSSDL